MLGVYESTRRTTIGKAWWQDQDVVRAPVVRRDELFGGGDELFGVLGKLVVCGVDCLRVGPDASTLP